MTNSVNETKSNLIACKAEQVQLIKNASHCLLESLIPKVSSKGMLA